MKLPQRPKRFIVIPRPSSPAVSESKFGTTVAVNLKLDGLLSPDGLGCTGCVARSVQILV